MNEESGMLVSVYKADGDSDHTNGGVTSQYKEFVLLGMAGPFIPGKDAAISLRLVKRIIGNKEYIHAEPVERPEDKVGPMWGGNFVYSSDSRFSEVSPYPIPVHDRFETTQENERLSV